MGEKRTKTSFNLCINKSRGIKNHVHTTIIIDRIRSERNRDRGKSVSLVFVCDDTMFFFSFSLLLLLMISHCAIYECDSYESFESTKITFYIYVSMRHR